MKTLPNSYLFEEAVSILKQGGTVKLRLVGGSMAPLLRGGRDTVVIVPAPPAPLRRGTVALFRYRGHYLLHRITGYRNGLYRLRGDALRGPGETAAQEDIAGILHSVVRPSGRTIRCNSLRWRILSCFAKIRR